MRKPLGARRWFGGNRAAFLILLLSSGLHAEFSSDRHIHTFFNARLLEKAEWELAPVSGLKYGLTENLELGMLPYAINKAIPNLFLKHRMFQTELVEVSFTSYTQLQLLKGFRDYQFLSLHGVAVTASSPLENLYINAGPARILIVIQGENDGVRSTLELELYSIFAGFDYYLSSEWAVSGLFLLPITTSQEIESEAGDESRDINNLRKLKEGAKSYVSYLTVMRSWDIFSLDFGILSAYGFTSPYINLIWRFR
ncbi:MAG: hypothetical protein HYW48_05275 [Deltaproteobacteria bacterium]|nr:hypothetical protein [Deltaproteobacteria bacterium]